MGYPHRWILCNGKPHLEVDDGGSPMTQETPYGPMETRSPFLDEGPVTNEHPLVLGKQRAPNVTDVARTPGSIVAYCRYKSEICHYPLVMAIAVENHHV